MCRCVSIIPGITMPPLASISSEPSGASSRGPTAAILSPVTSTSASARIVWASSMVSTVPPRSTTGRPAATSSGFVIETSENFPTDKRPLYDRSANQCHCRPPAVRDGISTYYLSVNRNKRSVALDLRDPGDLAAAHELARRADVFIENFKPGGLARFKLDYDSVSVANPAVVYASISGFGSGPKGAALPGYDRSEERRVGKEGRSRWSPYH